MITTPGTAGLTPATYQWTTVARRLGLGSTAARRAGWIRTATAMAWHAVPPEPRWLEQSPVAELATALFGPAHARLASAGAVSLAGGRRLIGLADATGMRCFLLAQPTPGGVELLTEAVLLFTERPSSRRPRPSRIA